MNEPCVKVTAAQSDQYSYSIPYTRFYFSGGEVQVRLRKRFRATSLYLNANLRSAADIMELLMLTDALRRESVNPAIPIHLTCPYFPYARQDRVCVSGEALSAKVMCSLINSMNYASVTVWDAHSDVVPALLDRCVNVPVEALMPMELPDDCLLIAPDAGAVKRVHAVAKAFGRPMIAAEKHRDPITGVLTDGTTAYVPPEYHEKTFLIVDDICDGGRTFIALAKVLIPQHVPEAKINLWVTHGIFSQGFDCFHGLIDQIYTPNPFPSELPDFVHKVGTP